MHTLTVFTICSGRFDYIDRQLSVICDNRLFVDQYIFVFNGCANQRVLSRLEDVGAKVLFLEDLLPIGAAINFVKKEFTSSHVLKLDDDAIPFDGFFENLREVINLNPNASFSAFPVGLLRGVGGPPIIPGKKHDVAYSERLDAYYTLRPVKHIGGFCRVSPVSVYNQIELDPKTHSEDKEFSLFCKENSIDMYYLENGLVVEHAETALGQNYRNKSYFSSVKHNKIRKDIRL